MSKRIALVLFLLASVLSLARDKPENWLEARSQHFTVVTNANEKAGRRIADQFERMRSVFHVAFPHLAIDNSSPVIVLAIKDEKDFRALEPESYLAKGQLKLGGLFLRVPDKNYVLMSVDAEGEHPYSVIYHEYTHLLLSRAEEWIPLWLNEGLAQFYENTDIHEKDVSLGQPSRDSLGLLREKRLLPLTTLFTVDTNSPYYHEENKGSIFYAESWALTHYIYVKDTQEKAHRLSDYAELLTKKVDAVTAATRAFGDLNQLQSNLETYIHQGVFSYFKMPTSTDVDDASFKVRPLPRRKPMQCARTSSPITGALPMPERFSTMCCRKIHGMFQPTKPWGISSFAQDTSTTQPGGTSRRYNWIRKVTLRITTSPPFP